MRRVATNANAAAQGKALQETDDGFGEFEKAGVHAVFIAPEPLAKGVIACKAGAVHVADVATGAERPACALYQKHFDFRIVGPADQCGVDGMALEETRAKLEEMYSGFTAL